MLLSAIERLLDKWMKLQADLNEMTDKSSEQEGVRTKIKRRLSKETKKLHAKLNKRLEAISDYMETGPGMKLLDKVTFNFGVIIFAALAYIMGRSSTLQ